MSVIGLVNQAVAWYAASAVLAFLFAMRKPLSGAIAGIGGAVASAMLVVAAWRRAADAGADPRRHAAVSPPDDTGGGRQRAVAAGHRPVGAAGVIVQY